MIRALLIEKRDAPARLASIDEGALPDGDVLVRVTHSTLNYKDALALTGRAPIARTLPLVPGIDLAGAVIESRHPGFVPGDRVLCNGQGLGETRFGGLAERCRLFGDWLLPIPPRFSARDAMAIGTAGYTAALALDALDALLAPPNGPGRPSGGGPRRLLVTGAGGGVGGTAVALASRAGWHVLATTGRPEQAPYLRGLGAAEIVPRAELAAPPPRPLLPERWDAAIDSLGGQTLAQVLAATAAEGVIAACGLAEAATLPASVLPFILRGVTLRGINSVYRSRADRLAAWDRLDRDLSPDALSALACAEPVGLDRAVAAAEALLAGRIRGRIVVAMDR